MTVRKKAAKRQRQPRSKKMSENRISEELVPVNGADVIASTEEKAKLETPGKKKLTDEEALAVSLLQEREKSIKLIVQANELNNTVDELQKEVVALKRELLQEQVNALVRENEDLRKKYSLPDGNAKYVIEDGAMYLVEPDKTK